MIEKLKNIRHTVKNILATHPETRDSDRLLLLKVWSHQNNYLRNRTYTFYSFALDFLNGTYADPESVRRIRQKIQEEIPSLRGEGYYQRKKLKREVQTQIKDFDV